MLSLAFVTLLFGADPVPAPVFTDAEEKLIVGLSEPERLYVKYAVTHMIDGEVDVARGAQLKDGEAGKLVASGVSLQVVDEENMIVTDGDDAVWLSGAKAEADDDNLNLHLPKNLVVVVNGSKSYATVTGAQRTVKRLEVVNLERVSPFVEEVLEGRGMRTWTISRRQYRGRLKSTKPWPVIETPEGKSIRADRSALSDEDKQWITEELKRRQEALKKPK